MIENLKFYNRISIIFIFSSIQNEDGIHHHSDKYDTFCQMMLAVHSSYDPDRSLFSGDVLRDMFFEGSYERQFTMKESQEEDILTFTDCKYIFISIWKIMLPIIMIVTVSVTLMLIAWRYQYLILIKDRKRLRSLYMQSLKDDDEEDTVFSNSAILPMSLFPGQVKNPLYFDTPNMNNNRKVMELNTGSRSASATSESSGKKEKIINLN
jgi:hypothetical protein